MRIVPIYEETKVLTLPSNHDLRRGRRPRRPSWLKRLFGIGTRRPFVPRQS